MTAVGLLKGSLTAADYEDAATADPRLDALRGKMEVVENADFTRDYLDPAKRSIGNAVRVFFRDGSATERVAVEYPVGHRRRRAEGIPLLMEKFAGALRTRLSARQVDAVLALAGDPARLDATPVPRFVELFVV